MPKTLVVTNDFPPRPGGIQAFVHQLVLRQPADSVVVYASNYRGAAEFDAAQPFPVIRDRGTMLLPTPRVARRAARIVRAEACDTVWFGAMAPLGLLAPALRRVGVRRFVAQTHGHEIGWAMLPGARSILRRIARNVDVVTYLGEYTRRRLARAIGGLTELAWLPPGVDTRAYRSDVDRSQVMARHHLAGRPVVVCVSRLVPRKGQDTLIRAMPEIRRKVPDVALLIVGGGPYEGQLRALVARRGLADVVLFTGTVPWAELPAHYAAGDVFAMPCRTRRGGLDVEGLGIVYLEASATEIPVVAGDSGGAPDAVLDGETGYVVNGRSIAHVAERITALLRDRELATRMGKAGRSWVERQWQWEQLADRMRELLHPASHS